MTHAGNHPTGFFRSKSHPCAIADRPLQYLGLPDQGERFGPCQLVSKESAVILSLRSVPGHSENAITMRVVPCASRLYMSVMCNAPLVDLYHTQDHSGRQIWVVRPDKGGRGWQLTVSGGHEDAEGRHTLSCAWQDYEHHVDLWLHHPWFMEELRPKPMLPLHKPTTMQEW